jgi:exodeoxyribonuclease VII small subunit
VKTENQKTEDLVVRVAFKKCGTEMSSNHETLSFEQQLARLQDIVTQLEDENLPLEQGVALFEEGTVLAKSCREQIKKAKHKVQIYSQGLLQDLDLEDEQSHDQADHEADP